TTWVDLEERFEIEARLQERRALARPVAVQVSALGCGRDDVAGSYRVERGIAIRPYILAGEALDAGVPAPIGQRAVVLSGLTDAEFTIGGPVMIALDVEVGLIGPHVGQRAAARSDEQIVVDAAVLALVDEECRRQFLSAGGCDAYRVVIDMQPFNGITG